jgi:hypothetical protein
MPPGFGFGGQDPCEGDPLSDSGGGTPTAEADQLLFDYPSLIADSSRPWLTHATASVLQYAPCRPPTNSPHPSPPAGDLILPHSRPSAYAHRLALAIVQVWLTGD